VKREEAEKWWAQANDGEKDAYRQEWTEAREHVQLS